MSYCITMKQTLMLAGKEHFLEMESERFKHKTDFRYIPMQNPSIAVGLFGSLKVPRSLPQNKNCISIPISGPSLLRLHGHCAQNFEIKQSHGGSTDLSEALHL